MDSALIYALLAIFAIGATSITLAALLSFSILARMIELMISQSVGMM